MVGSQHNVGVLGVRPRDPQRFLDPEERRLLETCASLVALSLERDQSLLEANQAQVQIEAEQLRNVEPKNGSYVGVAQPLIDQLLPQVRFVPAKEFEGQLASTKTGGH